MFDKISSFFSSFFLGVGWCYSFLLIFCAVDLGKIAGVAFLRVIGWNLDANFSWIQFLCNIGNF